MVVSQLLGIPFSFTAHAWDIFKEQAMLPSKLLAADFTVTISKYNLQFLSQLCPTAADRIHVIRCGVNLARFSYRNEYPSASPPHILSVSRLTEKKGVVRIIEACVLLRDQGIDFACTIVGDGPQRAALQRLITARRLQNRVKLVGGLVQSELRELWQRAHVFVLPCTIASDGNRDGIPIALMEAMALGVPVISTTISGIPELIEDGVSGLLVPPDDVDALGQAIVRLLSEPKLATRLAREGRHCVEREYDVRQNTTKKALLFETARRDDHPREAV
jgi:glycosyltransferase involved in cell wall biosynthesis